jgi:hypothetical protein
VVESIRGNSNNRTRRKEHSVNSRTARSSLAWYVSRRWRTNTHGLVDARTEGGQTGQGSAGIPDVFDFREDAANFLCQLIEDPLVAHEVEATRVESGGRRIRACDHEQSAFSLELGLGVALASFRVPASKQVVENVSTPRSSPCFVHVLLRRPASHQGIVVEQRKALLVRNQPDRREVSGRAT